MRPRSSCWRSTSPSPGARGWRRARCPARCRTTSSRNTSRAAPTSTRRARPCASSPTSSRSASGSSRSGIRFRSAAITSAKPDRPRCRKWRSRSLTPAPTCSRRSTAASTSMHSDSASPSSSTPTTTSSRRSPSSAARRLWARRMKERFGATNPRAQQLRFHTQTAGSTLTAQQPDNNIVRVALQALAAVLGGTQSLHCNGKDEALALPTEESATIALRTQQIILRESGGANNGHPVGGSFASEEMTTRIEGEASELLERIDRLGGTLAAIESGYIQQQIQDAAYRAQQSVDAGDLVVVGVNQYADAASP